VSIRLNFVVEGQTEETFVNRVLRPHLATFSVWASAHQITTSRRRGAICRGGHTHYGALKKDLLLWTRQDQNADAAFTTMIDLFALPTDFPGYDTALLAPDPWTRVKLLEQSMKTDLNDRRLVPYIQVHEFEALIFTKPDELAFVYSEPDHRTAIQELAQVAAGFSSPEMINDGRDTAPSRRLASLIPEFPGMKSTAGPLITERIGLTQLRQKCMHFHEWLSNLEALPQRGSQ